MKKLMAQWRNELADAWMSGEVDRWMELYIDERMDGQSYGWIST
jgi:hypothetical protein